MVKVRWPQERNEEEEKVCVRESERCITQQQYRFHFTVDDIADFMDNPRNVR